MSSANFLGRCRPACSLFPERKNAAYRYVADVLNETSRPRFCTQPIGNMTACFLGCKQNGAKNAAYRYVADVLNETSRPRFSTQPIGNMTACFLGCKQNGAKNAEGKSNAQLSK